MQRQILPNVDDRGTVELGETDRSGLLKAVESKDRHSLVKAEENVASAVKEEPTIVYHAGQMQAEALGPSETVAARREYYLDWERGQGRAINQKENKESKNGSYEEGPHADERENPRNGKNRRPGHEILGNKRKAKECRTSSAKISRHRTGQESQFHHPWDPAALPEGEEAVGKGDKVLRSKSASDGGNAGAFCHQKRLRLGRWLGVSDSGCRKPRPTPVDVANPRLRDRFLASADKIKTITTRVITVKLDDAAIGRGYLHDSIACGCKYPTSESKSWMTEGN